MVHPVAATNPSSAEYVDANTGAHAVIKSRRSFTIKEKPELLETICIEVYKAIPAQTVQNSWMKKGFDWF